MDKARRAAQSRSHLDKRLKPFGDAKRLATPLRGWTKAVREALGMTTAQVAKKLGVKQPTVVAMEQSEAKGTIEMATLRRVAEALDCTLVYAILPNKSLDAMVRDRARLFARRRLEPVEHSMLLEDQAVRAKRTEKQIIDEIVRGTNPRLFWD